MRLSDVEGQKVRAPAIAVMETLQTLDRASERGSSEAAEDENRRLGTEVVEKADACPLRSG
jgi:hypothetical protein